MRKYIGLFFLSAVLAFVSCQNTKNNQYQVDTERQKFIEDSIAQQKIIEDSIAREQFLRDSIFKVETIKKCEKSYDLKTDEFKNLTWVTPKSAPKYRNRNGAYCYFSMKDNQACNFRFVFQYYADDWLFIKNMIFNIDGENLTIVPDMETDCGDGGMIWEWCDEMVIGGNTEYLITEDFIKKIAGAKTVKVRLNGRQYYNTKTLTDAQIKSIKETYEYYIALGGSF